MSTLQKLYPANSLPSAIAPIFIVYLIPYKFYKVSAWCIPSFDAICIQLYTEGECMQQLCLSLNRALEMLAKLCYICFESELCIGA